MLILVKKIANFKLSASNPEANIFTIGSVNININIINMEEIIIVILK